MAYIGLEWLYWCFSLSIVLAVPALGSALGQPVPKSRLDTMPKTLIDGRNR